MATFNYKGYTVLMEQHAVNGSVHVSAMPDGGKTLRKVFYGHSLSEVRRLTKAAITAGAFD